MFTGPLIHSPCALSRLAPNLPRHCSEVHICECNSVRSVHHFRSQTFLCSRTDVGIVNPPGIERLNRFQKTLEKGEIHLEVLHEEI